MASSPPTPSHSSLPNPKKRPSIAAPSPTTQPGSKRPKLHPLRQTSFPATDSSMMYPGSTQSARSETGSIANSMLSVKSSKTGQEKRGRGRPRKNGRPSTHLNEEDLRASQAAETGSFTNGADLNQRRGTKSIVSARSPGVDVEEDDDGDLDGVIENMDEEAKARAAEEEAREAQRIDRLTSTFDDEQTQRYLMYRRATLQKATLKRLVNQTVSQSVTDQPLQAIKIASKFFVGEIVERAREVQMEWAEAWDHKKNAEETSVKMLASDKGAELDKRLNKASGSMRGIIDSKISEANPHKGGLLPDHLREALRRYKGDGEGGGAGFGGLSLGLLGIHGAGSWRAGGGSGAKRLFK